jgi:hypothetical protein
MKHAQSLKGRYASENMAYAILLAEGISKEVILLSYEVTVKSFVKRSRGRDMIFSAS